MSGGRPSDPNGYFSDDEKLKEICDLIVEGNSIRSILGEHGMPSIGSFYREMEKNEAFRNAITRAKQFQQEDIVDSMIELADTATPENVNVVKLQIWARQWRAMKLYPKRYGEQTKNGDVNVHVVNNVISEEKRQEIMRKKRESAERMLQQRG